MEPMICSNCGAPINLKLGKCEYCDTIYHIGWDEVRILQLNEEKINNYRKEIIRLQTQVSPVKLDKYIFHNLYLMTNINKPESLGFCITH